jgi:hypothetical protein
MEGFGELDRLSGADPENADILAWRKGQRRQEALRRALEVAKEERSRLAPLFDEAGVEQQTPEQIVYGHAPGYGPDLEADRIERMAGPYQSVPGWYNADQFADVGGQLARAASSKAAAGLRQQHGQDYNAPEEAHVFDEEFRKNRHLLSPQQFAYMQDIGRTVDLLRGLRAIKGSSNPYHYSAPEVALSYWDKSDATKNPGSIRAREDFNDPNYQRFSGVGGGMQSFFTNTDSPVVQYFKIGQMLPDAMRFAWERPDGEPGSALQKAQNARTFSLGNMLNGENPVLREPVPKNSGDPDAWTAALSRAGQASVDVSPPPYQNIVNSASRAMLGADAPAVVGDLASIVGDSLDPTMLASFGVGLPARVAAYKAAASAAGRPAASLLSRLARSAGAAASDELKPEIILGTALNSAGSEPTRTYAEYMSAPAPDVPLDAESRNAAHLREEVTALQPGISIPEARSKAYRKYAPGYR